MGREEGLRAGRRDHGGGGWCRARLRNKEERGNPSEIRRKEWQQLRTHGDTKERRQPSLCFSYRWEGSRVLPRAEEDGDDGGTDQNTTFVRCRGNESGHTSSSSGGG